MLPSVEAQNRFLDLLSATGGEVAVDADTSETFIPAILGCVAAPSRRMAEKNARDDV
jgi:hypothetical protein